MIGEQLQLNNDGTLTISAKIPGKWLPLLRAICEMRGTNMNNLIKMCLQFLIETAMITTEPSPDMKVLLHMMKVSADWQRMFQFVSNADMDIAQCILILQQSKDGKPKDGFALAMFDKPFMGDTTQTLCVDSIVERVIEIALGYDDYMDMRQVSKHFDAQTIREALVRMVDAQIIQNLTDEDNSEMPDIGHLTPSGRTAGDAAYGKRTKRKHHKGVDMYDRQQRIQFTEEDRELAREETERSDFERLSRGHSDDDNIDAEMGFRPHGQEW